MILAGTTADKMRGVYSRPHRNSIYDPASIHDIPFEVLHESFLFLVKQHGSDLVSASLTCRAFRAVAIELMNSRKRFVNLDWRIGSLISGLQLRSIVGLGMCTIKHLIVDIEFVGKEYIPLIAHFIAPTLASLGLRDEDSEEDSSTACYEALGVFFENCDGILALLLEDFDFGDDPAAIPQAVNDGCARLSQLNLAGCRGFVRMFLENTPISNLRVLTYRSGRVAGEEEEILVAIASNCRALTQVKLIAEFESSASLLKVVEYCRNLERLLFGDLRGILTLERSDILAIASLPRLNSLWLGCRVASDAKPALARCKGLKELHLGYLVHPALLSSIGGNLTCLDLWAPSKEVSDGIVENCPNLQYLELGAVDIDDEGKELLMGSIKSGLKKLANLTVNDEFIRLGTDWIKMIKSLEVVATFQSKAQNLRV